MLRIRASPRCAPSVPRRRNHTAEIAPDRPLAAHPIFAPSPKPGTAPIKLVYGKWEDKFVVINKPAGLTSQQVPDQLYEQGVVKRGQRIHLPHRLDKHTEGLMVVGLDRFAASLLSRDLEAGRWGRKYRAIVEKPPCCQQSPTASAPARCCMNSSLVQGKLIQEGKLATAPVQIASFLARSAVNANDPRDSLWAQREEKKRTQSKPAPCELVASQLGAENPVPATLRWQSVSEMHPEAKLCVTTVTLLKENAKFALYEVLPETGRPHQMRVQLAELGFPIASDPYYNTLWLSRQLRLDATGWGEEAKMLLQAYQLEFPDPFEARTVSLTVEQPLTL